MSHHDFRLPFLAVAALAAVAGAQTGAGPGTFRAPNQPYPFDPGPRTFSVRVEPRADFLFTGAATYVNVPGAASSFVAYEDSTNVSVTFSAEAFTTTQTGRVFVRALLDGEPMQPGDVVETFADIEATVRDLGWRPAVTIEAGLPRFAAWHRAYHARR